MKVINGLIIPVLSIHIPKSRDQPGTLHESIFPTHAETSAKRLQNYVCVWWFHKKTISNFYLSMMSHKVVNGQTTGNVIQFFYLCNIEVCMLILLDSCDVTVLTCMYLYIYIYLYMYRCTPGHFKHYLGSVDKFDDLGICCFVRQISKAYPAWDYSQSAPESLDPFTERTAGEWWLLWRHSRRVETAT